MFSMSPSYIDTFRSYEVTRPDWEKNMTKYEKPVLVCSLIFYILGLVLGNQIVSVVSLLPLVWLIVIEVRVISQKLKGNSIL